MFKSLSLIAALIILSFILVSFSYSQMYTFYVNNWGSKYTIRLYVYSTQSNIVNITFYNFTKSLVIITKYNISLINSSYFNNILNKYNDGYLIDIYKMLLYPNSTFLFLISNKSEEIGLIKITIEYSNLSENTSNNVIGNTLESSDSKTNFNQLNTIMYSIIVIVAIFLTILARVIKKNK